MNCQPLRGWIEFAAAHSCYSSLLTAYDIRKPILSFYLFARERSVRFSSMLFSGTSNSDCSSRLGRHCHLQGSHTFSFFSILLFVLGSKFFWRVRSQYIIDIFCVQMPSAFNDSSVDALDSWRGRNFIMNSFPALICRAWGYVRWSGHKFVGFLQFDSTAKTVWTGVPANNDKRPRVRP